jgi:uncharacterized membrane protein YqhA
MDNSNTSNTQNSSRAASFFERLLWQSRLIMIIPVFISLLLATGIVFTSALDSARMVAQFAAYANPSLDDKGRSDMGTEIISRSIELIDEYLLAAVLLVFGFGIYELFIGKIDPIGNSELASRLLLIQSLDDLKNRLAAVVLLILIVKFAQIAIRLKYQSPQDLLFLAIGIALIGGALFLSSRASHP